MRVFIAHASEDVSIADSIAIALRQDHHDVFFADSDFQPSSAYHARIRDAIASSDLFVFLLSPASLKSGAYTLTELRLARERWPDPSGCVLPVAVGDIEGTTVPGYLQAVDILYPEGHVAAEVAAAVTRIPKRVPWHQRSHRTTVTAAGILIAALIAIASWYLFLDGPIHQIANVNPKVTDNDAASHDANLNDSQRVPDDTTDYRNATQEAQVLLQALGYDIAFADGFEGPSTTIALEDFQRNHNLPVTGAADPTTLEVLRARARKEFLRPDVTR